MGAEIDNVEFKRCPSCGEKLELQSDSCARCGLSGIATKSLASDLNPTISIANDDEFSAASSSPQTIAHFAILDVLGQGSFGYVYKAQDLRLNRIVALKRLKNADKQNVPQRFEREIQAAAQIPKHPNVVAIYEAGSCDDGFFLSTEYVEGGDLRARLEQESFAIPEVVNLMIKIASGVGEAHRVGVIHRDLKPANILLDLNRQPRVSDFGLAKRLQDDLTLTRSGDTLGSPSYMSPEQASGHSNSADARTDVWSLGVILYQLVTDQLPFSDRSLVELYRKIQDQTPKPPSRINRDLPVEVEAICLKCLEKSPGDRYVDANALAADLLAYANGEPIKAKPNKWLGEFRRWSRKRERIPQIKAMTLITTLLFGMIALIGFLTLSMRFVPISRPGEAWSIVGLDVLGFVTLLCVWLLDKLMSERIMIVGGMVVGGGIAAIVGILVVSGFEAGGLLAEPFNRVIIYSIFGLVGCALFVAHCIAWIAHRATHDSSTNVSLTRKNETTHQ